MKLFVALLIAVGMNGASQAQAAPEVLGTVTGHVVYADTQQPARLASVTLQPVVDLHSAALGAKSDGYRREGVFHLIATGLDGSFTIPSVPQGLYYVIVEQDGFVSPLSLFTREQLNHPDEAMLRRISMYMTPVSVTAGHTSQATVRLIRGAVISGNVRFEDGSPAVGVGINVMHRDDKGAWVTLRTGNLASHGSGHTDDQGAYRFSGLPGEEYLVRATVELSNVITDHIFGGGGSTSYGDGYHLQIYPGDAFRPADAKPVKVEEGESVAGNDIDVPLSKLYSLSGTVQRANSALAVNAAHLTLTFADDGTELTSTDVNSNDGSFRFDFVPGGSYVLKATTIGDVQRTEIPNCKACMPPSHTETKVVASYGDASQPIVLTGDQSGVLVQAGAPKKP